MSNDEQRRSRWRGRRTKNRKFKAGIFSIIMLYLILVTPAIWSAVTESLAESAMNKLMLISIVLFGAQGAADWAASKFGPPKDKEEDQ